MKEFLAMVLMMGTVLLCCSAAGADLPQQRRA